jgi:hypothetical protein
MWSVAGLKQWGWEGRKMAGLQELPQHLRYMKHCQVFSMVWIVEGETVEAVGRRRFRMSWATE